MSGISSITDGISLYCSREIIANSERNNGFPSLNGNGEIGNSVSYRRSSYNDFYLVDDDETGIFILKH